MIIRIKDLIKELKDSAKRADFIDVTVDNLGIHLKEQERIEPVIEKFLN